MHRVYCFVAAFLALVTMFTATPIRAEQAQESEELVFIFQKQKDPAKIRDAAEKVAEYLSEKIGQKVRVQVPLDYSASVQALVSKTADFAYVSSLPFLLARRDGGASVLLVEQRVDTQGVARTEYDSVFVVHKDSPLQSMDDLVQQAGELQMVFTSATSTSGYIFAYSRLVAEGVLQAGQDPKEVFKSVQFGGGYSQAAQQVAAGRADVAAVSYYAVEGESAQKYLSKEELENIRVLARTPGVPTHVVAARAGLSKDIQERVKAALLSLANEKPQLLSDVYGTATFVEVDEQQHVRPTAIAVERIGLPIQGLM